MFLSDGSDHQNLEDESCRLKVKAPSHGRRAKNRVNDIVDAISFRFSLTPFSARTDVSTRASGLIIVPWRKGVCACVSDCLWSVCPSIHHESDQKAFCSIKFCLFGIMEQNYVTKSCHDFSTLAQAKV